MPDLNEETPYQSLYRRFRPATFAEVRGQDHVVLALRNAVRDGRVAHAYLFSGPRGTGKTSTARILAKALNCTDLRDGEPCGVCTSCVEITRGTSMDVHELDAASNNGVDAMRDLVSRAALGSPGRQKVYIVDEVHMLSTAASNALLKTLEEPPAHVVFVLATTDPQKVLPTIRSRTQHFEFRLLGPDILSSLLAQVRDDAHLDVGDEALDLAVRRGRGSARDALSVLDQVAASETVDDDLPELDEVVESLAERDVERALVAVAHLTAAGFSPQQLTGDLVDHLRQGFLALVAPELVTVAGAERDVLAAQAGRVGLATLVRAMEDLGRAQIGMRDAPDPRVNLEVALVRLVHPEADDSTAALLARIERLEQSGVAGAPAPSPRHAGPPGPGTAPPAGAALAARAAAVPGRRPTVPVDVRPEEPSGEQRPAEAPPATEPPPPGPAGPRPTLGAHRRRAAPAGGPPVAPEDEARLPAEPIAHPSEVSPGPEPAASTSAPASSTSAPFPSRDELVQAWGDQVIGRLRPKAKALFQAGRFVGADGEQAEFGLPNQIHRNRCEEMRPEVEAALADQFGRPIPLVLVVDAAPGSPATPGSPSSPAPPSAAGPRSDDAGTSDRVAPTAPRAGDPDEPEEDLSDFDDVDLEVAEIDNSAQARLLQAFPGAEEVV
ncbi:MAG: DNA polymerase III subunit gamma/tau [Acidimicrobiales bacterium]